MNKKVKVIVGIILIFFIVLSVIILITAKNKGASENKEVSKTSNLTSTILKNKVDIDFARAKIKSGTRTDLTLRDACSS